MGKLCKIFDKNLSLGSSGMMMDKQIQTQKMDITSQILSQTDKELYDGK